MSEQNDLETNTSSTDTYAKRSHAEIVRLFCEPSLNRNFNDPFSDENFTYATDGRIVFRTPRMDEFPNLIPLENFKAKLPWDTAFENQEWQPLPNMEIKHKWCPTCDGDGHVSQCPDCDGEGCDGDGIVKGKAMKCSECRGTGLVPANQKIILGKAIINARYIHILGYLHNIEIAIPEEEFKPIPFRCDEGVGFVMPMRA